MGISDRVSDLNALPQDQLEALMRRYSLRPISGGEHTADSGDGDGDKGGKGGDGDKGGGKSGGKGDESGDGGDDGGDDFKAITSQEQLDAALKARLKRQEAKLTKDLRASIVAELQTEAAKDEATKQGNFKTLYETAQTEIEDLKGKLKGQERTSLVAKVAAKHNLPADLADVLKGETEEELEAHAKKLAKVVKAADAPDTEAGKGSRRDGKGKGGATASTFKFGAPGQRIVRYPGREAKE